MDNFKSLKNINIDISVFYIDDKCKICKILCEDLKSYITRLDSFDYKIDVLKYFDKKKYNLIICNISDNEKINQYLLKNLKILSKDTLIILSLPSNCDLSLYDSLKSDYEIHSYDKSNIFAAVNVISNATKFLQKTSTINSLKNKVLEFKRLVELYDEYIIASMTDEHGVIRYVTKAFSKVSGYSKEELIGKNHSIVRHKDQNKETFKDLWKTIKSGKTWNGEIKNRKKDGGYYWVYATITPEYDKFKNIIGFSAIRQDITEKKHILELSITDDLTKLFNKRHFDIVLQRELKNAKRHRYELSFMIIDIDFFKQYNDTYGHQEGDEALKKVSLCIQETFKRPSDYCFRIGGEEFAVIFNVKNQKDSLILANRLRNNIQKLKIEHKTSKILNYITISAGLSLIDINHNISDKSIYKQTDDALYDAKKTGRNKISLAKYNNENGFYEI